MGSVSPRVRLQVLALTKGLKQQDFAAEIMAIHGFVRDNIRYIGDVLGVETLHYPEALLELGQGDCDDKAMLVAAMLMSIRNRCRFVVLKRGGQFAHVWTQVQFSGKWIDLETTLPIPIGKTAPLFPTDQLIYWPIKSYDYPG